MVNTLTPPTFDRCDVDSWKQYLDTAGYAVICDVLEKPVFRLEK